jgi:prolipoprotein diacylglyceryl transferase
MGSRLLTTHFGFVADAIPSPPFNGIGLGPFFIHMYAVGYIVGIACAVALTRRRWHAAGGDKALVEDIAIWAVPAGIIGGRIYFDVTTPGVMPHTWWGPFAVWQGGLGIWGGVLLATFVGIWRIRKAGARALLFMDAAAPGILIAQAIGRIGNYFNQELFGGPTNAPWGLHVDPQFRPPGYTSYSTFHPTFLYELLFDLAWAAALIALGNRTRRRAAPGVLFALYIAGYSAFRIYEESLRVDYSEHFLGLRLNTFVSIAATAAALVWTVWLQRRRSQPLSPTKVPVVSA